MILLELQVSKLNFSGYSLGAVQVWYLRYADNYSKRPGEGLV